ncbi:MAG: Flagellar hook-length control protein FliK [Myxococcales bacterium]|nr:Flagellar hook-length control protein FliK [Myxococcales bacterium]
MKRPFAVSAALSTVLALGMFGGVAFADPLQDSPLDVRPNPFAVPGEAPRAIYRWTDPSLQGAPVLAPANVSHVIYLNNCQPNGCSLSPGYDDSTTNHSSIPNGSAVVQAYSGSAANWAAIVSCVQHSYAPFNVQIVTTKPTTGNYHMAIVAGRAANVGEQQGVLGVSPFSCGYIPNSISFTFANEEPTNILDLCWTVAQETAHSWGLDHKFDNRDPMTYLQTGPAMKTFQNQAGACGEYNARTCSCTYAGTGNQQMNSYALIMATFGGSAPDTMPPTVTITSPTNNASVMAGFPVRADIADNVGIAKAELRIDGTLTGATLSAAPWVWNASATIGQGSHHIEVTAYDQANNTAKAAIEVSIGTVCTASSCTDPNQVCVDGHCVAGPDQQGGLGSPCTKNSECASNACASDGTNMYCVEPCDPTKEQCPTGFGCLAAGTGGVCWPGAGGGGGGSGGCNTGDQSGMILLGLGFGALLITRRRR